MPPNEGKGRRRIIHGKPYEGKLHVRIDEGSPETGWQVTTALVTYSTSSGTVVRLHTIDPQLIRFTPDM
jgi:hypothetical protein